MPMDFWDIFFFLIKLGSAWFLICCFLGVLLGVLRVIIAAMQES